MILKFDGKEVGTVNKVTIDDVDTGLGIVKIPPMIAFLISDTEIVDGILEQMLDQDEESGVVDL